MDLSSWTKLLRRFLLFSRSESLLHSRSRSLLHSKSKSLLHSKSRFLLLHSRLLSWPRCLPGADS